MKYSRTKKILILFSIELLLLLTGVTASLYSQDNEWPLKKCLEYALENSLDVKQSEYNVETAAITTKQNKSQRHPNFNIGTSLGLNFGRTVDPTTNDFITTNFLSNGFNLNSQVMLYNGGRIANTIKSSEHQELAMKEDLTSTKISMAFDIARVYFNALLARENVANITVQVSNVGQEIERMNKMITAGTRAQAEIYDLQAQEASSQQELSFAQNNYEVAMVNLKSFMNISYGTEMILVEPNVGQVLHSDPDLLLFEEAYKRAIGFSPSNRAQDYRIKSAEYDLEATKAGLLPSVSAGGNINTNYSNQAKEVTDVTQIPFSETVTIDGVSAQLGSVQSIPQFGDKAYNSQLSDNLYYGVGVQVNVPIYNNYQTKANIERSKVNLESLRTQKEQAENNLRNTIQQLLTDARGAKRVLEASDKTLRAREIASQNAEKRFQLGALNSYDYINIKNQYNQALISASIAKYDYIYKVKVLDYYQGYPVEF